MFASDLSVFIPYVFPNVGKDRIASAFESNTLGVVDHVDLVEKVDSHGKHYNYAFVHFSHWFNNDHAARFLELLNDPSKQARLVYDDPWFWIVLPNTGKAVVSGSRKQCIDLGPAFAPRSMDLVDTDYVSKLESEIAKLYIENMALKDTLNQMEFLEESPVSIIDKE